MKLFTSAILLLYLFTLKAQVIVKPQAIISCGKSFQKPTAGVTFTVAEIVVKPMKNDDVSLSNGVIASSAPFIVTKVVLNKNDFQFQLFPNPTNEFAVVKMQSVADLAVLIKVTDLTGKQILEQNLPHSTSEFSFSVNNWSSGLYILNIYDQKNETLGFIKFQKK